MRSLKNWLLGALVLAALDGALMVIDLSSPRRSRRRAEGGRPLAEFRWPLELLARGRQELVLHRRCSLVLSQCHGMVLYHFDKLFGKTGFQHGDYKPPVDRAVADLPRHDVYHR